MSTNTILYILLGVAIFVFISIRQLGWQPVRLGRLMRMPLLMFGFGIFTIVRTWTPATLAGAGPMDFVLIGIEIIVAAVGGRVMGNLAQISTQNGQIMSRLRPAGLAIWFGFIVVRIGFDGLAHVLNLGLAGNTVLIMFMLGIVKGVQALTMNARVNAHQLGTGVSTPVGSRI